MGTYNFTVVGTAATVSVLKVDKMPVCGMSTPVNEGCVANYSNGGMGLNICVGLSALSFRVYPVLTYADARQHDFLYDVANGYCMPLDGICDPPKGSCGTTLMIQDSHKNHMTLITEYQHRLPKSDYFPKQVMQPHFFDDSDFVILTAPLPRNTESAIDAIIRSRKPLVLSMRKDKNAFPHDLLYKALMNSSFIFANETEVEFIVQEYGLTDILGLFQNEKLRHIIKTVGKQGCLVYSRTDDHSIEEIHVKAVEPETEIVDTVGAGDGFVSGFMYGIAKGRIIKDCALLGSTFASFILQEEGGITNLPCEKQLLDRFERNKRGNQNEFEFFG